ncbi:MAG: hypothetical protein F6K24_22315 [Okeania sp. SIO2D1]|nr:hypothetical protein [Okeania sp. SIO2D1]
MSTRPESFSQLSLFDWWMGIPCCLAKQRREDVNSLFAYARKFGGGAFSEEIPCRFFELHRMQINHPCICGKILVWLMG